MTKKSTTMTPEQKAAALCEQVVRKVFVTKWHGHTYYIQEMPAYCNTGRNFAVMKDRKKLYFSRFETEKEAVEWLLGSLSRELNQLNLF